MPKKAIATVDAYIAAQPTAARDVLERVRSTIRKAVPRAQETIAYQMPAFQLDGTSVLLLAGWKHHYSLYPASDGVITAFAEELAAYDVNDKGTMRFPLTERVPVGLIGRIAKLRAKEVAAGKALPATATARRPRAAKKA